MMLASAIPRSLFAQVMAALTLGLVVSHLAGWWIYSLDREQAVRAVGGFATAERIVNLTKLVRDTPVEWRGRIIAAMGDHAFRVTLTGKPAKLPMSVEGAQAALAIESYLRAQSSFAPGRSPEVAVWEPSEPSERRQPPMLTHEAMMHGPGAIGPFRIFRNVQVAMPIATDEWLVFLTVLAQDAPARSRQFFISMGLMAIILALVSYWAVRRVTAPLGTLANAAERIGEDINAPPLPETGAAEVDQASRAFNAMQARLRNLIETRTIMLAAISHDLRTPLTLLRLRTETIEDDAERDKILATIADMDAMLTANLHFARDATSGEQMRKTDMTALLESVVHDMMDAGLPVTLAQAPPIVSACQPGALRRVLANLLDNAIKYGGAARAAIRLAERDIEIVIDDDGPGIPADERERVFEPFYRLDRARSEATGGSGLGLAIARSIVHAHGGRIVFTNRTNGGGRVMLAFPCRADST